MIQNDRKLVSGRNANMGTQMLLGSVNLINETSPAGLEFSYNFRLKELMWIATETHFGNGPFLMKIDLVRKVWVGYCRLPLSTQ